MKKLIVFLTVIYILSGGSGVLGTKTEDIHTEKQYFAKMEYVAKMSDPGGMG
ncbi:hypothetical protein [Bacillus cereus]|uniref:Uncharacterized protein n=1 Tax=Bacillus cereus VD184 TaxID=1053242 RepID=A0A9W5VPF0_BACCE|nr:hypothetical protein [Bacillus cereus]EOQ00415.1 hypothetical protein IKC_06460 [Bacillus cereus VD184]